MPRPLTSSIAALAIAIAIAIAMAMPLALPAHAQDGAAAAERRVASVEVPIEASAVIQAPPPAPPTPAAPALSADNPPARQIDIGRATDRLLSLQTNPEQAQAQAPRPRPIAGEQARRSYARYLKSFETDIPALYKTGSDSGGRN